MNLYTIDKKPKYDSNTDYRTPNGCAQLFITFIGLILLLIIVAVLYYNNII